MVRVEQNGNGREIVRIYHANQLSKQEINMNNDQDKIYSLHLATKSLPETALVIMEQSYHYTYYSLYHIQTTHKFTKYIHTWQHTWERSQKEIDIQTGLTQPFKNKIRQRTNNQNN